MKITFIAPGFPINGGVRRILMLSNIMKDMGHDVVLLSEKEAKPDWFDNTVPIEYDFEKATSDAWVVYECCHPSKVEYIATKDGMHYLLVLSARAREDDWIRRNITNSNYYKIATTEWLRDYCNDLGQKNNTFQSCIYTGIDKNRVHRVRVQRHPDVTVGLYANSIRSTNMQDALRAFDMAQNDYPYIRLLQFDAKANINPNEVKNIYSQCDIWLNAADTEGIGMPPLEAMACGCALVTTDTCGNRFYAKHNNTALVCQPHDVEALASNLKLVVADRRFRNKLAEAGKRFAHSLSWDEHAKAFERGLYSFIPSELTIICTSYNRKQLTERWVKHILEVKPHNADVLVVDDCSTDGTQEMLLKYPKIKTIFKKENTGFSHTVRTAQEACNSKWVLVTQNDCFYKEGSIDALIDTYKRIESKVGDIGCIGIAGGMVGCEHSSKLHDWSHWNGDGVEGYDNKKVFNYVQVDYINGFCMLYRGDVARHLDIYFDTRYKYYWEDIDICFQWTRLHNLPCIMVSMDSNDIPLIHHERNQTIVKLRQDEYVKVNEAMERVFKEKWF